MENVVYNWSSIAEYDYYNNGLVKYLKNGSLEQSYDYDEDLNLTRLKIQYNRKIIVDNSYSYDSNGNRTRKFKTNGVATKYVYNENKQVSKVIKSKSEFLERKNLKVNF